MINVRLIGAKQLENALLELTTATAKNVGRRSLRRAGQPLADTMNAYAPEGGTSQDGPLNESYTVSTKLNKSQAKLARKEGRAEVFMYVGTADTAGVQQEFGNVNHGAQPHARPAWDSRKEKVLTDVLRSTEEEVTKAAARARRKALRGK